MPAAPGQIITYYILDKQGERIRERLVLNTTEFPYPAKAAKETFAEELAAGHTLLMKVGKLS